MTFTNKEIQGQYEAETPMAYVPSEGVELATPPPVNDNFMGLLSNCPSMHSSEIDGVKWTDVTRQVMKGLSDRVFSSPQAARQLRARSIESRYKRDEYGY